MMRVKLIAMTVLLSFAFGGCASIDARKKFAEGAGVYSKTILPEYKDYVDKDTTLEPDSKRIRKQTADEFQHYIEKGME